MITEFMEHRRSFTKDFNDPGFKLPNIKKKGTLNLSLSPKKQLEKSSFDSPTIQIERPLNYSPVKLSLDIPKLSYSAFKMMRGNFSRNRRMSDFGTQMNENVLSKYTLKNIGEPKEQISQNMIKDTLVNKKVFKRIEPSQIEDYSKNFGQKLIRVQELVIDPLMAEGEFN